MTTPSINVFPDYGWLRGFNVIPSWGASIEEAWWHYHPERFRAEIALAAPLHANCIRLWIEFTAWMADPEKVQENFMDAIDAIDLLGMKTMPVLFNRWHDRDYDYGGTYLENIATAFWPYRNYLQALVTPLVDDARILAWDLCNEPSSISLTEPSPAAPIGFNTTALELNWLNQINETVRGLGVQQPITIGTMNFGSNIDIFAPLCDVLCCHPYAHTPDDMERMIKDCQHIQSSHHNKPMLCNECCLGSDDDLRRAEMIRWTTEKLSKAGYGWMGWGLKQGKAIASRPDRMDGNGLDGKGWHAWYRSDNQLRDGLDFLKEQPNKPTPWQHEGMVEA